MADEELNLIRVKLGKEELQVYLREDAVLSYGAYGEIKPTHDSVRAKACRKMAPYYSFCLRCGMPWNIAKDHTTWYEFYDQRRGCFPLCEKCWEILGCAEARIEYYATLFELWESGEAVIDEEEKRIIAKAVANGR